MTPSQPEDTARGIVTETLVWRGITVSVSYEVDWLGSGARGSAFAASHLQVEAIEPERAKLPITETGYRSHFLAPGTVEETGGPAAYVAAWLDHDAQTADWRRYEAESRQLTLF